MILSHDLDRLVVAIREVAGEQLDRVILYGSFAWGGWNPESSDIDVAILLRDAGFKRCGAVAADLDRLKDDDAFSPASGRIDFATRDASGFFALKDFPPCMESKVLRLGRVLWESPVPTTYAVLPAHEAQKLVVERGFAVAAEKINYAWTGLGRTKQRGEWITFEGIASERAQMSACFSLRALAYARGIDPSAKPVRWSVPGLLGLLGIDTPTLAAALPDKYHEPAFDRTEEESRRACAAALRIYREVRRETRIGNALLPASQLLAMTRKLRELQ